MFTHSECFTCNICHFKFIHSTTVDHMTPEISLAKSRWNDMVSSHYLNCTMRQADSFYARFCKFLKAIGIDASIKED